MKLKERQKAKALRQKGYSLNEITAGLHVAKSSVSLWVRDVVLNNAAQKRIRSRHTKGQIASQEAIRIKTRLKLEEATKSAHRTLTGAAINRETLQLMCSLIYWCEGAKMYKNQGCFSFTNSDPALVRAFLRLLRSAFDLDEVKFSACIHLHSYHKEETQLKFWSKVTSIPSEQFIRSFRKKESGISIRDGYQGCISVRYYDAGFLRRLLAIASEFLKQQGP